jgi:hypothetical protein
VELVFAIVPMLIALTKYSFEHLDRLITLLALD